MIMMYAAKLKVVTLKLISQSENGLKDLKNNLEINYLIQSEDDNDYRSLKVTKEGSVIEFEYYMGGDTSIPSMYLKSHITSTVEFKPFCFDYICGFGDENLQTDEISTDPVLLSTYANCLSYGDRFADYISKDMLSPSIRAYVL